MQPLSLTLKGFRGIRDGLGLSELTLDLERLAGDAQLIAIAGPNGSGKTTVMDNLTPYNLLPSRAAGGGPGGFSYYDHVYLPESLKDLVWAHEGRSYRSQIVIRLSGRRKTEAFLHRLDDDGNWCPVALEDGTVSDGKVDTYVRCVEAICGSADTFFTSVFSAQNRRQLSTYRNGEIKALLADLLGQAEIQAMGQKAIETARLLKAGLTAIRQEQAGLEAEAQRIAHERLRLDGAPGRVAAHRAALQTAQAVLEAARTRHAQLLAERGQSRGVEARRAQLQGECQAVIQAGTQAIEALKEEDQRESRRLDQLAQRVAQRLARERSRRQALQHQRRQYLALLSGVAATRRAEVRLPLAERVDTLRLERLGACREQVQRLAQCQASERLVEQQLSAIEREAGQAALHAEDLARRLGLTGEVPCAGTGLQGRCQLLGDAHAAQVLMPSARGAITRLACEKAKAQDALAAVRGQREALGAAPRALARSEHRAEAARDRVARLALLAAQAGELARAETGLAEVERELAELGRAMEPEAAVDPLSAEHPEEAAERQQIQAARQAIAERRAQQARHYRATLDRLRQALAALPAPYDEQRLTDAQTEMEHAARSAAAAEQAHLAAVRDAETLGALARQADALAGRQAQVVGRVAHVEAELGNWNLFARCMSHDGLIALAIDDAGPALSSLANDLLLACYGPRFTVSILTLVETAGGEQKEGFDILVHDGESGESKSVGLMSGGERTWIESCLTRAIALYLAQHTGRRYETLFSDEADGPLDAERKRMFMAMKREVLRLGGYRREFFVSQTPELTAMADAVIDLEAYAASTHTAPATTSLECVD